MVKIPTYEPTVELRPEFQRDLAPQATPQAFGSDVGAGMENLAKGGMSLSKGLQHVQDLIDHTTARAALNDFTQRKDAVLYGDGGYGQQTGQQAVEGFDDYKRKIAEAKRDASSKLTPAQQTLFARAADTVETDAQRTGLQHRGSELKKFVVDTATSQTDTFKQQAVNTSGDPVLFEKNRMAMAHTIADLGHMQGWSDDAIKAKVIEQQSDLYRLTSLSMSQSDPVAAADFVNKNAERFTPIDLMNTRNAITKPLSAAAGRDAIANVTAHGGKAGQNIQQLTDKIIAAESGGDASATNQNSSAAGLGQFIDGTWLKMVKANRPDIAAGKSNDEILAMKSDPQLGREMTMRYAQDNASSLQQAGIAPTAGNVYLAHFLGPGGAKSVLSAGDDKKVEDVLSPSVISANGFLRGKTVADLKAWAEKKMGGNGGVVPTYSPAVAAAVNGMPGNLAAQVREASHNEVSDWSSQQSAEIKAQRLQVESDFRLRMANGDTSLSSAEILNNTTLDNGEKAALLNTFNEKMKTVQQTQADVAAFEAGKLAINPYGEKDHKRVDNLWEAQTKNLPAGSNTRPILDGIVQQTGTIPAAVSGALRSALTSRNPQTVSLAATAALQLRAIDPYVFQRREGGSDIEDKAVLFDHLTSKVGMSSLDAAAKISALNDPTKKADRDALLKSKDTEDWLKNTATESNARSVFSPGFFSLSFTPKLGDTPAQAAAATAEYRDMLSEALADAHGDKSLAQALAGDRFKRRYAPSKYAFSSDFEARDNTIAAKGQTATGSSAIVRLPPEVTYPAGVDGTHDYIGSQAKEALAKQGVTADVVYLMPNTTTEADVAAGRPARYDLYYKHDGIIERAQHPFYADPPSRAEVFEAKKRKAMSDRDVNRAAAEVNAQLAGTVFDPNLTFPR